jgi:hypothetical protein
MAGATWPSMHVFTESLQIPCARLVISLPCSPCIWIARCLRSCFDVWLFFLSFGLQAVGCLVWPSCLTTTSSSAC